jgi:hypothetical protein
MMKNVNEPIVGAQYDWQGMPCAISNVEPSTLAHYKYLVTVEYFDKRAHRWSHVKTPWLSGAFKLVLAPHVST